MRGASRRGADTSCCGEDAVRGVPGESGVRRNMNSKKPRNEAEQECQQPESKNLKKVTLKWEGREMHEGELLGIEERERTSPESAGVETEATNPGPRAQDGTLGGRGRAARQPEPPRHQMFRQH